MAAFAALFAAGCGGSESKVVSAVPAVAAGLPGAFPPLADSPIVTETDPGKLIRIVLHGLQGPIEVQGITYISVMPPPGASLTDQDVADVLTYVRSAWGNEAAPVAVEAVTAIRTTDPRSTPWTWAELQRL